VTLTALIRWAAGSGAPSPATERGGGIWIHPRKSATRCCRSWEVFGERREASPALKRAPGAGCSGHRATLVLDFGELPAQQFAAVAGQAAEGKRPREDACEPRYVSTKRGIGYPFIVGSPDRYAPPAAYRS